MNPICEICGGEPMIEFKGTSLCKTCYRAYRRGYYDAMDKIRRITEGMEERE